MIMLDSKLINSQFYNLNYILLYHQKSDHKYLLSRGLKCEGLSRIIIIRPQVCAKWRQFDLNVEMDMSIVQSICNPLCQCGETAGCAHSAILLIYTSTGGSGISVWNIYVHMIAGQVANRVTGWADQHKVEKVTHCIVTIVSGRTPKVVGPSLPKAWSITIEALLLLPTSGKAQQLKY